MATPYNASKRRRQSEPNASAYPPTAELTIARIPLRAWALLAALAMVASLLPAGIASPIAAHADNANDYGHCDDEPDLFVAQDGKAGDPGTEASPTTITDAVSTTTVNTTIGVHPGTYEASLTVDTKGMTLCALDKDDPPTIDAEGADRAIDVKADDVTIQGLKVVHFEQWGITDRGARNGRSASKNLHIKFNEVTSPKPNETKTVQGIQVEGTDSIVSNNQVTMITKFGKGFSSTGILAESTDGAEITHNTVESEDLGIAISTWFGNASSNTIKSNHVSGSTEAAAISLDTIPSTKYDISDTDIRDNTVEVSVVGLRVVRRGASKITGTTLTNNEFIQNGWSIHLQDQNSESSELQSISSLQVQDNTFRVSDFSAAKDLASDGIPSHVVVDPAEVTETDGVPTLADIRSENTFPLRFAQLGEGVLTVGERRPISTPTPTPEPEAPAPPERTPAPDPEEQVEVEEPEVPEGTTVERERGTAGAIVDGVEVETSVSTPEVAPSDPDVPPSEEEVEQRRTVTRQFVDEVLADVPENQRGVSVVDTDDGAAIVGLLADRDDATQSRPVPPTAVAAVSAGDVRLLAAVTDRRGNPRDRAEDGTLRGAPGGDAAVRMFGLPSDTDGQVQVRSTARVLGVVTTDDAGRLASQVEVPSDLPPGDHTLVVTVGGNTTSIGITVEADFDDVAADSTHVDAIEALAEDGVFQGRTDGTFGPQQGLVRGQMATVLARLLELDIDPDADIPFDDVAANSTHAGAIAAIEGQGFTEGCDNNGRFCPDTVVTRGQLAAFLARAYDLPASDDDPFTDIATATLADEIRAAAAAGVVQGFGDDTFRPNETVTRAQAATMLFNAREVAEE